MVSWAQAEIIRFTFYTFRSLKDLIGHLRYNLFLVFYPLGVGSELVCVWDAFRRVDKMPEAEQPWTVLLPNAVNFEFKFSWAIYSIYAIYSVGFPILYSYMLA